MKELRAINPYLSKYKQYLIWGTIFVIISNVFAIWPAQLVRYAFDLVNDTLRLVPLFNGAESHALLMKEFGVIILVYGVMIVVMAFIRGGFLYLMRQTLIVMSRHIEYDMKSAIYQHYQELPLSFYRKNNTGDLMARISEDVGKVRMYLGPAIMYGINLFVTLLIVIGYMLTINVKLTVYSLLPLPLLSICIYYISSLIDKRSTEIQQKVSGMSTFVQEAFSGIRVLKAFVREADSHRNFSKESEEYKNKSVQLTLVNSLFYPIMLGLIGMSIILTVYVGGKEVINGSVTPGNIAEFILYVNMLIWPVTSLGWVTNLVQQAEASQRRINEFMNVHTDIISSSNLEKTISGDIAFKNVSFVYPDSGIQALKNISFEVKAGESLAILGTTGSGKSTIANLILRMYDVSDGEISIDNANIKEYNIAKLRGQTGYVPQDVFLFSDTLRDNIAFGATGASEEEIVQAAKDADVYDNIMGFPLKFDTVIGERGISLSGGQKQRVSIARALIRKPRILILDDSLSAVDTKTESIILDNLQSIMKGRTTIIISHRISSVKLADKIVVLDKGELVEAGTHDSLLEKAGVYKELYEKQLKIETSEEV